MWEKIKKFAPFAVVLGYALVYMNKGWDMVLVDLKGITIVKLQAKWQNIAIAMAAGVAIYALGRLKMPAAFKALVMIFLYVLIGYNVATAIDPPGNGRVYGNVAAFAVPSSRNPYSHGV